MKKINIVGVFFLLGIGVFILASCDREASSTPQIAESPLAIATTQRPFTITATVSPNKQVPKPSLIPTLDSTQQARRVMYSTQWAERTASAQNWNDKATKVAQFSATCDFQGNNAKINSSVISPDGNWIASSCDDQILIVQNREGTRWMLDFVDFLSSGSPEGMPGGVSAKFWSQDGKYLYFTTWLGYSGGGNQCFSGFGDYGLFRLNLKKGSWVTLISPTDSFPGYRIEFAPTGRRYATDMHGIMITDINTGEIITIPDTYGPEALSWSPDGVHLAYSLANCGEELVQTSSVYVWDALTNKTQMLFTTDGILLRPESWSDNSTLRISGEKYDDSVSDYVYTIYVYNITQNSLLSTGTATPSP